MVEMNIFLHFNSYLHYRETALLYDEKISSVRNKERVVEVIAHELAHQWFGNLVTMDWWTDLWLNEGFASYVEYLGAEHVLQALKIAIDLNFHFVSLSFRRNPI